MRWLKFLFSALILGLLLYALSSPLGPIPFALGNFLNPYRGFWQNAEPETPKDSEPLVLEGLQQSVEVVFDERFVPHIFAENEHDLFFVQGYLTAKDRLWQMEFQTHAAAGRLSEIVGPGPNGAVLNFDRTMRRKGMVYGANQSLAGFESNATTKLVINAYTEGVNSFIGSLKPADYPLEYKILGYKPEAWTTLKCALLLKYLSDMLAGGDDDLENTRMRALLGQNTFETIFPDFPRNVPPIIPAGTKWDFKPAIVPPVPANYAPDSLLAIVPETPRNKNLGSNNWAVAPSKSTTGHAILANDPHLSLNLPALWYEVQLHAPGYNAYGVSLPGSPCIILGFNDSIAWGATNGSEGVADYYRVKFKDASEQEYLSPEGWKKTTLRVEVIGIKGQPSMLDTVRYTDLGPVIYDKRFGDQPFPIAYQWMGNQIGNELLTFYSFNKAKGYSDYLQGLQSYVCPAQNFIFASTQGEIALWHQGRFVNYWKDQGKYLLDAANPEHRWQSFTPFEDHPHVYNPAQGYIASTNQQPTDNTYPYHYVGGYDYTRAPRINTLLSNSAQVSPDMMKQFQLDNYYVLAEQLLPLMLSGLDSTRLTSIELRARNYLKGWNYTYIRGAQGASIFEKWSSQLYEDIWQDEFDPMESPKMWPSWSTTMDILKDSIEFSFYKNIQTGLMTNRNALLQQSFREAVAALEKDEPDPAQWTWENSKRTDIRHLSRSLPAFSRMDMHTDGRKAVLNATDKNWGPSWRLVIDMAYEPVAWGVWPGGVSGNPGSHRYDSFVDDWAAGKYYLLWKMKSAADKSREVRFRQQYNAR